MRNGQNNKRMRGRNNNNNHSHNHNNNNRGRGQNPLTRVYESNGPDVKIRGNASHVADKYMQLARDAQSSGDPVAAENYYQHAEHYLRLIAAVHEQFRQANPNYAEPREQTFGDDGDEQAAVNAEGGYAPREQSQQPYPPREQQPYAPREQQFRPREQRYPPREQAQPYIERPQPSANAQAEGDVGQLPAFVTGGGSAGAAGSPQPNGQNGFEGGGDRYPLHRRRRRRHGPRPEGGGADDGGSESAPPAGE